MNPLLAGRGVPAAMGGNANRNYSTGINSNSVWAGINYANTFSTAAAIRFSTDEKTLPLSAFFGFTTIATDVLLCFEPDDPTTLTDELGKHLVDEFVPSNGFKSRTVKEFLKYGVSTYDN